jgi:hypothetical protein
LQVDSQTNNKDTTIMVEEIKGDVNQIATEKRLGVVGIQASRRVIIQQCYTNCNNICKREIILTFLRVNSIEFNHVIIKVSDDEGLDKYWGTNVRQEPIDLLIVKSLSDTMNRDKF